MTIHILEDMLRACVLNFGGSWNDHLPLVEFAYNFQSSIGMAPYEVLYGRLCLSLSCWVEVNKSVVMRQRTDETTRKVILLGPELIKETIEKITFIK